MCTRFLTYIKCWMWNQHFDHSTLHVHFICVPILLFFFLNHIRFYHCYCSSLNHTHTYIHISIMEGYSSDISMGSSVYDYNSTPQMETLTINGQYCGISSKANHYQLNGTTGSHKTMSSRSLSRIQHRQLNESIIDW